MNKTEKRAAISLASIFAFRMLGLFMILPVFSIYADDLKDVTPTLIGIALGIYGLTQAALQIPFGMLSDRFGRKPIIAIGLIIFAIGSIVAAMSHTITGIIIGRGLQGAGAVGSTIIALVADLTRDEQRTKAMAIIGMTIGVAFSIAMVLGPILNAWISVPGIFWLTAILAGIGIIILFFAVPTPKTSVFHRDAQPVLPQFKLILHNTELLRLDIGIFMLHSILTASFIVVPIALETLAGLHENQQWYVYLPVLILAFFAMIPFIIIAEKKRRMKQVFLSAIAVLIVSQILLWSFHSSVFSIAISLFIFFTVFTLLEASLPSLVSKIAPIANKGTAMGVYSSSQFLGIFFGGSVGGWLYGEHQISGVFFFCAALAFIWLLIASSMRNPRHLSSKILPISKINEGQVRELTLQLRSINGVEEVAISPEEQLAYLKVDNTILNEEDLKQYQR